MYAFYMTQTKISKLHEFIYNQVFKKKIIDISLQ